MIKNKKITIGIILLVMVVILILCTSLWVSGDEKPTVHYSVTTGFSYINAPYPGIIVVGSVHGGSLTIPSSIDNHKVVGVGGGGRFSSRESITSLTISSGIWFVSEDAFRGNGSIQRVIVGKGVTRIEKNAFEGCSALEVVYLDPTVTKVEGGAFSNCTSLRLVEMPGGVENIGNGAFLNCSSLKKITLPESVTTIGDSAFSQCYSLEEINIPQGVESLGSSVFQNCASLKQLEIPSGLNYIGKHAFAYSGIKNLTVPKNVTTVESGAFMSTSIEKLEVESGNSNYYSKDNCIIEKATSTLVGVGKNYKIPSDGSVKIIGESVFGFSGLREFTVYSSIESIGSSAFTNCYGLDYVYIDSAEIAKKLDGDYSCGGLISGVIELYINSGINEIPDYVTQRFPFTEKVVVNGKEYLRYCDHIHSYYDGWITGDGASDMFYHWHQCQLCDHSADLAEHVFDNKCDKICNVCHKEIGLTEHFYVSKHDSNYHWEQCSECGETTEKKPHRISGGCGDSCSECGYSDGKTHSFGSSFYSDHSHHWRQCSNCGAMDDYREHSFSSSWKANESEHYKECQCGYTTGRESHTPGPEATEDTAQICTLCKYVINPPIGHIHQPEGGWEHNDSHHWTVCSCGDRMQYFPHTFTLVDYKEPMPGVEGEEIYECGGCKYQMINKLDPLPNTEPAPTPTPTITPSVTDSTVIPPLSDTYLDQTVEPTYIPDGGDQTLQPDDTRDFGSEGEGEEGIPTFEYGEEDDLRYVIIGLSVVGAAALAIGAVIVVVIKAKGKK